MRINILPPYVYNRISAGEVVEKPASIVKELVENSIDAGATAITIEVEDGGKKRITVSDNGLGIEKEDLKSAFFKDLCSLNSLFLILAVNRDKHISLKWKLVACSFLCLKESLTCGCCKSKHLACGSHLRSEDRVNFLEHIEREDCFLYSVVRDHLVVEFRYGRRSACKVARHDVCSDLNHVGAGYLGYERYRSGCTGVSLEHEDYAVFDRILHVHETYDIHLYSDLSRVFLDGLNDLR